MKITKVKGHTALNWQYVESYIEEQPKEIQTVLYKVAAMVWNMAVEKVKEPVLFEK